MKRFWMVLMMVLCLMGSLAAQAEAPAPIDVDLTQLSSTMVYAEVYNMLANPEQYVGKVIRMQGHYGANFYEPTSQYYYYVVVEDAAACCQQGLEFEWVGDHQYPEEYPQEGDRVVVTGVLESYEELGYTYYHIMAEELTVVK